MFSKICRDIQKSRCTTGVKDTGGKFTTGVNDTSAKIFPIEDFFHLPPVSLTPVVHLELRISPRIYTYWYNQGLGGN
jgi:hypothetical protein